VEVGSPRDGFGDDRQLKFAAQLSPRARHHLEVRASSISRLSAVLWLDPKVGISRRPDAAFAKAALAGGILDASRISTSSTIAALTDRLEVGLCPAQAPRVRRAHDPPVEQMLARF
jgi:hypothetical protein